MKPIARTLAFLTVVSLVFGCSSGQDKAVADSTAEVAIAASHGPTVVIDRPFFYLVRDRGSGAILFLGHVVDPAL